MEGSLTPPLDVAAPGDGLEQPRSGGVPCARVAGGVFLGFIFGIPRTVSQGTATAGTSYAANTNLEQVSDWLTKILVGVALTQLTHIPPAIWEVAGYLGEGLAGVGDATAVRALAVAIIVYFLVVGFLLGFLWTRLYLARAMRTADQIEQIVTTKLEDREERDDGVNSLVMRQLQPGASGPPVTVDELAAAMRQASATARRRAFYLAQERRRRAQSSGKAAEIEPCVAIFRALIAADPEGKYHRNYGELGYALKDKANPDWREAEIQLTRAIEIRGAQRTHGWGYYEANRAVCRIHLDPTSGAQPSDPKVRERIVADLRAAAECRECVWLYEDPAVLRWLERNNLKPAGVAG